MTRKRTAEGPPSSSAAFCSRDATALDPPFVSTVQPSRMNPRPNATIFSRLSLARLINSRPFDRRCVRIALKSPAGPSCPGRCNVVIKYRWKRSVPAERPIGLGMAFFRWAVDCARRSRVSEIVEDGECVRSSTRASIAAMGMVRSGSERRSSLYVATMLQGGLAVRKSFGRKIRLTQTALRRLWACSQ
jgi:hypothetical protein